ncbi:MULTISPECIES: bacteriocin immunity protein [Xenorhabdus]|uniref:bacteriocin immunity protein n=1 Tax=Xenorhabdus TaxID=626 RepID=UPI00064AEEC1|nr:MULTISPECIES: bacteriocin immunity protein [Xenorhabdus]KLU17182.1 colicin immunity protein [Xenorhabdus griffiniae]KOP32742.1 colicin immunity protein [Xenorhabdus sp. GDc328]
MSKNKLEDYTEAEFLAFVTKICNADYDTEQQEDYDVSEFERLTQHPAGSDLIYYPEDCDDDSPAGIVARVKKWRIENQLPLFK